MNTPEPKLKQLIRVGPPKIDPKKLSLAAIKNHINRCNEVINYMISLINKSTHTYLAIKSEECELRNQISVIENEIQRLSQIRENTPGFFGELFSRTHQPQWALDKIQANRENLDPLRSKISDILFHKDAEARFKPALIKWNAWKETLESAKHLHEAKLEKIQILKAKAARNSNETRTLATSVKRKLNKQDHCPYCSEELDDNAHVDHIYPVSKGGKSTIRNMVYVCAACNLNKMDMTLQLFIKKYDLDRDDIESALDELGKDY